MLDNMSQISHPFLSQEQNLIWVKINAILRHSTKLAGLWRKKEAPPETVPLHI